MKPALRFFLFCILLQALQVHAGTGAEPSPTTDTPATNGTFPFSFEAVVELAYVGDSEVARGSRRVEDFDEIYSLLRFVYTPRISAGIVRLGASWERFSFGMPDGVQTPDLLQSLTAVVGFDTQFSDSILVRIEAQPGLYGAEGNLDADTFNVPFIIGGTYIYNSNLQFIFGLSVDFERDNPVLPGGGIRWRLNSQWVLNAVLPTPRLEFEATKNLTIYAGANLKNSTFRMDKNFGDAKAGDSRLNHAVMTYSEVRTGLGVEWKITPEIRLALEAGYMPWREFDFHRTNVRYHHEKGAAYGAAALSVTF